MGRELGVTDTQLAELGQYRDSTAFSAQERAALDLAVEMTSGHVDVPPELLEELGRFFDDAQLVELAAAIAWENYRARFNRALGIGPVGFSDGAVCALPEHRATPPHEPR